MRTKLLMSAFLGLAMATSLVTAAVEKAAEGVAVGQAAPDFKLDDQNGKPVSLADYKGKIVVLEWTNKDCPFVQRHLKAKTFVTLAAKYKAQDVVWLAIDSTHTHTTAIDLKMATDNAIPYPILSDSAGAVGKMYGAKSTPDMFIINKTGTLAYEGAIDNNEDGDKKTVVNYVSQALDEMLAGKSVSMPETKSYGCSVKYAK